MIVITGAAGFIGTNLITELNNRNYKDLVLVDDFTNEKKHPNFQGKKFSQQVPREAFKGWIESNHRHIQMILHMGARTDTTEFNWDTFQELNLGFSKMVWNAAVEFGLPLIYASSAATYGLGERGYLDSHEIVPSLKPLNPYGRSKNEFDKWALQQVRSPFFWSGLKFFNVYGPNEYHKGRMASVVMHAYDQIRKTGEMKLFKSHHPDFADGEQARDFIYVKDLVRIIVDMMEERRESGIFNLGTGTASTFLDLVRATFKAMDLEPKISFIDTPEDIRDKYQYYTCARMEKMGAAGYDISMHSLEAGVHDYVTNYLKDQKFC